MVGQGARPVVPVLVGGTGRSGTTVLGGMLGQHSLIHASMPREVKFITEQFGLVDICAQPRKAATCLPKKHERALARMAIWRRHYLLQRFSEKLRSRWWLRDNRKARPSGLHLALSESERESLLARFSETYREGEEVTAADEFVQGFIRSQRGYDNERYWIDTSPPNIAKAPLISQLLPQARFIWVVRDGRNTAASLLSERWGASDPAEAISWWESRLVRSQRGAQELPPDRILVIALEDLVVRERESTYRRILNFMDVDDDLAMRAFFDRRMPAERLRSDSWRERVSDPEGFSRLYEQARDRLRVEGIDPFEG